LLRSWKTGPPAAGGGGDGQRTWGILGDGNRALQRIDACGPDWE
jgi:hypothetical protein